MQHLRQGQLHETEAAIRLLLALMETCDVPLTSCALSAASKRVVDNHHRPPPNHFYPSSLVPRRALTEGGEMIPAVRMCAHAEERQRAATLGWARAEAALWARISQPPRATALRPMMGAPTSSDAAAAAARRRERAASVGGGLLGALRSPTPATSTLPAWPHGQHRTLHAGLTAADTTAATANSAAAAAAAAARAAASAVAFKPPTSPPPVGLKPPPLEAAQTVPCSWPGYLTDAGDAGDTPTAQTASSVAVVGSYPHSGSGSSAFAGGGTGTPLFRWWHEAHWGGDRGLPRPDLLTEVEAGRHALAALAGRSSASYLPAVAATAQLAALLPQPRMRTPNLSEATLGGVMAVVAQASSHTASLIALAEELTHNEREHGSVAFAFGAALRRVLRRQQEQLASLPDAVALREAIEAAEERAWAGEDEGDEDDDEEDDEQVGKGGRGATLLAVLTHARRLILEQRALYDFCFQQLGGAAGGGAAAGGASSAPTHPRLPPDFPTGVHLIGALYTELGRLGGVPGLSRAILWRLFTAACAPWLRWLRDALFRAAACDPHGEFSAPLPHGGGTSGDPPTAQQAGGAAVGGGAAVSQEGAAPAVAAAFGRGAVPLTGMRAVLPPFAASLGERIAQSAESLRLLQRSSKFEREELGWPGSSAPVRLLSLCLAHPQPLPGPPWRQPLPGPPWHRLCLAHPGVAATLTPRHAVAAAIAVLIRIHCCSSAHVPLCVCARARAHVPARGSSSSS